MRAALLATALGLALIIAPGPVLAAQADSKAPAATAAGVTSYPSVDAPFSARADLVRFCRLVGCCHLSGL